MDVTTPKSEFSSPKFSTPKSEFSSPKFSTPATKERWEESERFYEGRISEEMIQVPPMNLDEKHKKLRVFAVIFMEWEFLENCAVEGGLKDPITFYRALCCVDCVNLTDLPIVSEESYKNFLIFLIAAIDLCAKVSPAVTEAYVKRRSCAGFITFQEIVEMESLIVSKTGYSLPPPVPFDLVESFCKFIDIPNGASAAYLRSVYETIVRSKYDPWFASVRPSLVAAAAMLMITEDLLPEQVDDLIHVFINMETLKFDKRMIDECMTKLKPFKALSAPATPDMPWPLQAVIGKCRDVLENWTPFVSPSAPAVQVDIFPLNWINQLVGREIEVPDLGEDFPNTWDYKYKFYFNFE